MPSISETIIIGVLSGILTTVILYILARIFYSIILPWYQGLVYKGANISGSWNEEIDLENGNQQISKIQLVQKAHRVTGNISAIKTSNGQVEQNDTFKVIGSIQDRIFHAIATPQDESRVGRVAILLELIGEGHKLVGSVCWYDSRASRVANKRTEWDRE